MMKSVALRAVGAPAQRGNYVKNLPKISSSGSQELARGFRDALRCVSQYFHGALWQLR